MVTHDPVFLRISGCFAGRLRASSYRAVCGGVWIALALLLGAGEAKADVSSWFQAGGGITWLSEAGTSHENPGTLQIDLGVGSPPNKSMIVGGILRSLTFFGRGTDLAFAARGATGGFVRGDWGVALDAGMYQRWWGSNSTGFIGDVALGAPYGLQLTALTEQGSNSVHSYGVVFGIDFLRLTVYRASSQQYWPNPFSPSNVSAAR
jgi:hypothetical protein